MSPLENDPWADWLYPSPYVVTTTDPVRLEDVSEVIIEDTCKWIYPCQHETKITLHDGRVGFLLHAPRIYWLISELAQEKINPNGECTFPEGTWGHHEHNTTCSEALKTVFFADKVLEHFARYSEMRPEFNWPKQSAEMVLNGIVWHSSAAIETKRSILQSIFKRVMTLIGLRNRRERD